LKSQVNKAAKKRLSLSGLEILHGRLHSHRPHSSLDGRTPDQAYFNSLPFRAAA